MPIYGFYCNHCKIDEEVTLSVAQRDDPQVHKCGRVMKRVMSLPQPPIIRVTGKGMALDALNSDSALPDRWYKDKYTKAAAAGIDKPPKRVW